LNPNLSGPPYFLDFEKNVEGDRFYMMGFSKGPDIQQVVLSKSLLGLALEKQFDTKDPVAATTDFLELVQKESGHVVAYSEAERNIFLDFNESAENGPLQRFQNVPYLNLAAATRKWIRRNHRKEFDDLPPFRRGANEFNAIRLRFSLGSVMRLTSYQVPADYAPLKTTGRFNAVIDGLARTNQDYSGLTPTQKSKATKALKHNAFDVEALPILLTKIKSEDPACLNGCVSMVVD